MTPFFARFVVKDVVGDNPGDKGLGYLAVTPQGSQFVSVVVANNSGENVGILNVIDPGFDYEFLQDALLTANVPYGYSDDNNYFYHTQIYNYEGANTKWGSVVCNVPMSFFPGSPGTWSNFEGYQISNVDNGTVQLEVLDQDINFQAQVGFGHCFNPDPDSYYWDPIEQPRPTRALMSQAAVTVATAVTQLVAADPARRYLHLRNTSGGSVFVSLLNTVTGTTDAAWQISAFGVLEFPIAPTNAVYAIVGSGSSSVMVVTA